LAYLASYAATCIGYEVLDVKNLLKSILYAYIKIQRILKFTLLNFIFILWIFLSACSTNTLQRIIKSNKDLKSICVKAKDYKIQIRYTQIRRDKYGLPKFKSYEFMVNDDYYFYPASMVKLPAAILAVEKINELSTLNGQITLDDPILHKGDRKPQTDALVDPLTGKTPTVRDYIQQIFSISDNNAYNRIFELLGAKEINEKMYQKNIFTKSYIKHRVGVGGWTVEDNEYLPLVIFPESRGRLQYNISPTRSAYYPTFRPKNTHQGYGYLNDNDSLIVTPFDFSQKNFYTIRDMEATLKHILFPEIVPFSKRFNLKVEDYEFIRKAMSAIPRDYTYLAGDTLLTDDHVKFYRDLNNTKFNEVKIYNKVGSAYGYMTDCSYIINEAKGTEFMLTATIYVNKDGIFNDNIYEYDAIGHPFFKALGNAILNYEYQLK
jgi:hypothetical protein